MSFPALISAAGISATVVAFAALTVPFLYIFITPEGFLSFVPELYPQDHPLPNPTAPPRLNEPFSLCEPSAYHSEIISLDPLLIYLHSFLHEEEVESLLTTAESLFDQSQVPMSGQKMGTTDRISSPVGLPLHDHTVRCVLTRARKYMGTAMFGGGGNIGPPQLVRYTAGQQLEENHNSYDEPQWADEDDARRTFNQVATFLVTLQDNCTGGETYFPYIGPKAPEQSAEDVQQEDMGPKSWTSLDPTFREHQDGGLAFRPVKGNALFLFTSHPDGSKDERTIHVSLPVGEGVKIAMNI